MPSAQELFKEILLRDKLIDPARLEQAQEEQRQSGGELSRILLQQNLIPEDLLISALSESLNLPLMSIAALKVDKELGKLVPREMAEKFTIVPISKIRDQLTIAVIDPFDLIAMDNVKEVTGLAVHMILARSRDIKQVTERLYDTKKKVSLQETLQGINDERDEELIKPAAPSMDSHFLETMTEGAPIITLTNTIINQAIIARASDVFIEPLETQMRIRYRVDGLIREADRMSKELYLALISRIKVMSSLDIAEHRLPQDGRFRVVTPKKEEVDFRVSVLPTALGEKVVLRVLDKAGGLLDLDKLGFEPPSLHRLKESCARPHGLILACGPTGSGKTTTLYSILKYIDSPGKNIITVEDPVEFQVKGFNQVNIRAEVGLTFPASLRSILRQDPDIILIGEIRDSETMDIAVKAALTGHMVVSSLHTTTAPGSITRMINMGIEPFLLCSSLAAIVAQRLVRKVCSHCREEYTISEEGAQEFRVDVLVPNHGRKFFRGKGCPKCLKTGYQGRVGITETLIMTPKLKEAVLASASEASIKSIARSQGMITMREDAVIKACRGLTTLEEAVRITATD